MEQKINSGVLYLNDQRTKENQPNYRGNVVTATGKYSLSAWKTNSADPFGNNRGAIFVNDSKNHENHPDMIGCVNINGAKFYLAAWNRVSQKGLEYLSIAVRSWKGEFTNVPEDHMSVACKDWIEKA